MKIILALAFLFTTSAAFACEHDSASTEKSGRTVASAKAETGKTTTDEGGSCGEGGCSCTKEEGKACHCEHGQHAKACKCSECAKHTKGKTS